MPLDTIGARLLAARKKRGFSTLDVQRFTSIPANTLTQYEKGDLVVPADRLEILARLYGVSTDWIVTGQETAENTRRKWPEGFVVLTRLNKDLTDQQKEKFLTLANYLSEHPEALTDISEEEWDRLLRRKS